MWQLLVCLALNFSFRETAGMTAEAGRHLKAIIENVGNDVAIGYGIFFFIAVFVSVISANGFIDIKVTLADLLGGDMAHAAVGGGSGKGFFLVLLATATIAVPYFWKHKLAPLAFAVPLLFTVCGFWPLYEQHRAEQEAMEALGEFGQMMGQMAEQMGRQHRRAVRQPRDRRLAPVRDGDLPRFQGRDALPRTRLVPHYFIVGIVNSAPRDPSGQRAVTVLSRV